MSARILATAAAFAALVAAAPALALEPCANPDALGTHRVITFDAAGGARLGSMQGHDELPLEEGEIVLTFDDGPNPDTTPRVLDALDAECVKATFFVVSAFAERHPDLLRDIYARGHNIATHTWSHPILSGIAHEKAVRQIERGIESADALLAGMPDRDDPSKPARTVPWFRFPGLNETKKLKAWLAERDIAVWSCDIGTDDWRPISADVFEARAVGNMAGRGRGIVIMHDTQEKTADRIDEVLTGMKKRGLKVVHVVPGPAVVDTTAAAPETGVLAAPAPEPAGH